MNRLTFTFFSLVCARRVVTFPTLHCHYYLSKKRMPTTRGTTELTKRPATQAADGHVVKKKLSSQLDVKTLDEDLCTTSTPWYTFFTKGDAEYNEYMATEWGMERRGDKALFEKLSLEGAQSGLSWLTVLRKREAYRRAFHDFDPVRVASMTEEDVQQLIDTQTASPRDQLVRHRGKIESVINNAKCIVQIMHEESTVRKESFGVFDDLIWSFVDNKPILNRFPLSQIPSKSKESEAMSKELKKRGFKFVGPTACYSMMQALGLIVDHPLESPEWVAAYERLKKRPGGFQERVL